MDVGYKELQRLGEELVEYFLDKFHEFYDEREDRHLNGRYLWSSISKDVGWTEIDIEFPDKEEIDFLCIQAKEESDRWAIVDLLRYCRFLKGPLLDERREDMKKMRETLEQCRKQCCKG